MKNANENSRGRECLGILAFLGGSFAGVVVIALGFPIVDHVDKLIMTKELPSWMALVSRVLYVSAISLPPALGAGALFNSDSHTS